MKKISIALTLAALLVATFSFAQNREIYTNPNFSSLAANHKTVAILPFAASVKLRPNQMKNLTPEQLRDMEIKQGLAVQSALQTYFLKEKGKDGFTVSFQDAQKTNALLAKQGITEENIRTFTPEELAKLLEVDSIITGTFETDKPMSDGASLALGLAVGFYGSTNSGKTTINIYDGASGELLWKYEKALSRSLGSDTNTMVTTIMRKASRKFPYSNI
ncbi:MAG: hypothetical protein LPK07_06670 [Hymenobacteraceae bacterium]|nr:hypothetical protein [Hymenobacteraceae bacterium]MDX5481350.1 hypothetical protein [Hymenobacteraceae bacterium]